MEYKQGFEQHVNVFENVIRKILDALGEDGDWKMGSNLMVEKLIRNEDIFRF